MTDPQKSRMAVVFITALTFLVLVYNILQESFMPEIEGYLQRRSYYEKNISRKGLTLHKGMHWKEKEKP